MSKNDITISKKHGLNPSLMTCFWCRKESTGIALNGRLKGDAKAPAEIIDWSYTPCSKCAELRKKGILLVGVKDKPLVQNQPPFPANNEGKLYPNGSWSIATREWTKNFLAGTECGDMVDTVMEKGVLLLEADILKALQGMAEKADNS